jgi:hypothetical protein
MKNNVILKELEKILCKKAETFNQIIEAATEQDKQYLLGEQTAYLYIVGLVKHLIFEQSYFEKYRK